MDCLQDKFGTVSGTPEKPQTLLGECVRLVSILFIFLKLLSIILTVQVTQDRDMLP